MKTKVNVFVHELVDIDTANEDQSYLYSKSTSVNSFVQVGTADIEISFISKSDMAIMKRDALKEELRVERVQSQIRVNKILDQLSKLEALTMGATV